MKKAKKIFSILLSLITLGLLGCTGRIGGDRGSHSSGNTCECDEKNYKEINKYDYVEAHLISSTSQFYIFWQEIGDDGFYTGVTKEWTVYLTGYYPISSSAGLNIFYECLKQNNNYDYYLVIY